MIILAVSGQLLLTTSWVSVNSLGLENDNVLSLVLDSDFLRYVVIEQLCGNSRFSRNFDCLSM